MLLNRVFKILLFLAFLGVPTEIIYIQSPNNVAGDRQALMDLYEATGGNSWHNNSGWGNGDPSGSWHGVEVDADGRVTRLDLQDNGLTGSLPESIGNLTELKYLNIKQNALGGDLPSSLGNLRSVEQLLLSGVPEDPPTNPQHTIHQGKSDESGNSFTGTIPSVLGNLDNMEYLELSGSEVTGEIPPEIFNASSLKFVAFSWNKNLTGGIPSTIGNADNLIWLFARASNLDGTISDEISQATTLRTIHLGYNDEWGGEGMTGELPDFSPLTDLRNFNLDQNNFSGPWPDYWNNGSFDNLIMLRASWNDFHTDQLHEFDNLTQLKAFVLTDSDIQGTLPQSITQLDDMIIFSLGWTPVGGELPESGWDFHQLRQIRLNDTQVTGDISCNFWEGVDNPDLKMVHLSNSEFDSNCESTMNDVGGHDNPEIKVGGNNF